MPKMPQVSAVKQSNEPSQMQAAAEARSRAPQSRRQTGFFALKKERTKATSARTKERLVKTREFDSCKQAQRPERLVWPNIFCQI